MDNKVADGKVFSDMMKGALGELIIYEKEIDDLNVFPVPDGDTGANMRRTLELGVKSAPDTDKLNEYLGGLSSGMLLGARGNSGVILSQIFKGISNRLAHSEYATDRDILTAFSEGYVTAYNTVLNPVEGTILTVLRDGVERTKPALGGGIDATLEKLIAEMKKVLEITPDLLPVLKEAGVVDSGGFGLIKIVEGMLKAYRGEEIVYEPTATNDAAAVDYSAFGEDAEFTYGYCMEFILQLLKSKTDIDKFSESAYTKEISEHGNSIVVIRDKSKVRVHIHTFAPEKIMEICRKYGEFVFFKLDNMALQHNEHTSKKNVPEAKHKEFEIISVAVSDELASVYSDLGSGRTIVAGTEMNASVQDFLDAIESANADTVLVLPNDKNIVQTAMQAVKMYGDGKSVVKVLPTKSIADGYFALASDIPDGTPEERIESMREGAEGVNTVSIARATRTRTHNGIKCPAGSFVAFLNGELISSCADILESAVGAMRAVPGIEDKETALVFAGEIENCDDLIEKLGEEFPDIQIDCIPGVFSDDKIVIGLI